jgi:hypothetical protein
MLGGLAAALRRVAQRAECLTLGYQDGGVVFRSVVLGILFGAVIGLFANQLGSSAGAGKTGVASLTPAALSLLAGYAVTQVFEFLDRLAKRIFA